MEGKFKIMGISIIISLFIFNLVSAENFLTLPFYNQTTLLQGWFYNDGSIHKGIDYRCTIGDPLYAAADGLAMHSTQKLDSTYAYGNFVFINHENGFATLYAHLSKVNDDIKIYPEKQRGNTEYAEWTRIKKGDYIGDCGNTGTIVQHLHFEATKGLYGMDKIDSYDLYKVGKFYPYNESAEKMGTSSLWEFDPPKYLEQIETESEPQDTPASPERSFWQRIIDFFTGNDNEDAGTVGTSEVGNENEEDSSANAQSEEKNKPEESNMSASYFLSFTNSGKTVEAVPGEIINLQAQVKNTGSADWQRKNISANVVGGLIPNAVYHHSSWLTALRPTLLDKDVPSGGSGSFSFKINVPENPGEYIFQIQVVRVDNNFSNIPTGFWKVKIIVKTPTVVVAEEQESRIQDKIKDLSEKIGEEVDEVIEEIQKIVEKIFYFEGTRTPPAEDNNEEENILPEITLLVPNTTVVYTTSTSYSLSGNYNTSTYHILVNGLANDNIFMVSGTWTYDANLAIGTNTLRFVGWNEDLSVSSTELSVEIIRGEEIIEEEKNLPEITLDNSISNIVYTTSTSYSLSGSYNTSTYYILVNSTTTIDLSMSDGVWNFNINLDMGTNTLHFVGWNEDFSTSSAELLVNIIRGEEIQEEVNLSAPIILNPTTSSVYYTSSSVIMASGEKAGNVANVFLNRNNEITTTTILSTTTWEINLNLDEGENNLIFYGTDENSIN
ncbi:MAG: M23 family metallopeptidase, partial [Candidatus Magasanikiibacteriota bacterium]